MDIERDLGEIRTFEQLQKTMYYYYKHSRKLAKKSKEKTKRQFPKSNASWKDVYVRPKKGDD